MQSIALFGLLVCGASALHIPSDDPIQTNKQDGSGWETEDYTHPLAKKELLKNGKDGKDGTPWLEVVSKRASEVQALRNMSILFYGDSFVEHWRGEAHGLKATQYAEHPKSWKTYFEDRYGPSHASGIGGDRIRNLLYRLENGETPKNAQAKVILLHIGTNDLTVFGFYPHEQRTQKIFEGYQAIVKKLKADSPQSTIVLTGLFPRDRQWPEGPYKDIIPYMNELIEKLADGKTTHYVGCSDAMIGKDGRISREYAEKDYFHLSEVGAQRWAKCLQPTLDKILLKAK